MLSNQNNEIRFFKLFQAVPMPIILTRLEDGRCLEVNASFTKMTGITLEEALGHTTIEILRLDPSERERFVQQLRQHGSVENFETKIYTKQGELRWVLLSLQLIEIGYERCILGTLYDITERKRLQKALYTSEQRYRSVVNVLNDGIVIQDGQGIILTCNESAERILGLPADYLLGSTSIDPHHQAIREDGSPFPAEEHPAMITLNTGRQCLGKIMGLPKADGTFCWFSVNSQPLFQPQETNPHGVLSSFTDITNYKNSEQALRRSEQLYRTLICNLPDAAVMLYDRDLRFTLVEGLALERAGYDKRAMEGKTLSEIVPPKAAQELEPVYHAALAGKTTLLEREKDGRRYYSRILPVKNDDNEVFAGMVMVQDITELKQAEIRVAAEKERLLVTLRSIGDGVITTDTTGHVILINNVAEALTGWKQKEAEGKPIEEVFQVVNEQTRQSIENPIYQTLKTGQIIELASHSVLLNRNTTERNIGDSAAPIRDSDNQIIGAVLVFRDITEQQKIAEEMIKSSKLEALGVLAGGIAHDFNNLLTSIMGNLSLARIEQTLTNDVLDLLDSAEKAALRSKDLTQQLLTFARGGAPIKEVTHLSQVIRDSARFALHGANVRCVFDFPSELWAVKMDSGQISQVIQNLVLNAAQAMPAGGTIYISKENLWLGEHVVDSLPAGRYLKVSIRDEGSGIKPDILSKIFDPYFTTKAQGSGLGLAVCYSIIKNHDGHIEVHSEVGHGTTFCIYLPALSSDTPPIFHVDISNKSVQGHGRILVMDDESSLRHLTTRVLQRLGYEVQTAKDGEEAVELYHQAWLSGQFFDAVMLDLTVPGGMGGRPTIAALLAINPEVKVIVCSGYSNDPIMANYREYGFSAVLPKPYTAQNLNNVLQDVLMS